MQVFVFTFITQISEDTLTGEEISIKTVTDHLHFKVIGAEIYWVCAVYMKEVTVQ